MNINDRFKALRFELKLNQEDMGQAIGLSKSGISNIESGSRNVTDKHIKLLSVAFNVNENWLRTGIGNMFVESDDSLLAKLASEYHMTDAQRRIITTFLHMDEEKREAVSKAFFSFVDSLNTPVKPVEVKNNEEAASLDLDDDPELKHRQEIIAQEYAAEKKEQISSASISLSGKEKDA